MVSGLFVALCAIAGCSSVLAAETNLPTVSLIMPTFSRPEFVRHALESVARQTYPMELINEIVVVDDSPDEFRLADLRDYQVAGIVPVVYVELEERASIGRKRNVGVSKSTVSLAR